MAAPYLKAKTAVIGTPLAEVGAIRQDNQEHARIIRSYRGRAIIGLIETTGELDHLRPGMLDLTPEQLQKIAWKLQHTANRIFRYLVAMEEAK